MFGRGTDAAMWYRRSTSGMWGEWLSLGGTFTSDPAASGCNAVYVFGRGTSNRYFYKAWNGTSFGSDWTSIFQHSLPSLPKEPREPWNALYVAIASTTSALLGERAAHVADLGLHFSGG